MEEEVHLAKEIGERFGLEAEQGGTLERLAGLDGAGLRFEVFEGFDEEAAGAAGGIEDGFAKAGIEGADDELDDGTRGVELAGVAGGVAHLAEHRFVEVAESEDLFGGGSRRTCAGRVVRDRRRR
jgi:hypothetical protein